MDQIIKIQYLSFHLVEFEGINQKFSLLGFFLLINQTQEFRREGWTETAVILCKLNKSL